MKISIQPLLRSTAALLILACLNCRASEFSTFDAPTTSQVEDSSFGYLMTHMHVESESPLPHLLPPGPKYSYRILGVTQQGNCVDGCPESTVYVASWSYSIYADGHIRLCKIDNLRFYSELNIKKYDPKELSGDFLIFEVHSRPEPRTWEQYEVRVSPNACSVRFVRGEKVPY